MEDIAKRAKKLFRTGKITFIIFCVLILIIVLGLISKVGAEFLIVAIPVYVVLGPLMIFMTVKGFIGFHVSNQLKNSDIVENKKLSKKLFTVSILNLLPFAAYLLFYIVRFTLINIIF
jgi:cytosine/uracil/thiamine/allantoin permease